MRVGGGRGSGELESAASRVWVSVSIVCLPCVCVCVCVGVCVWFYLSVDLGPPLFLSAHVYQSLLLGMHVTHDTFRRTFNSHQQGDQYQPAISRQIHKYCNDRRLAHPMHTQIDETAQRPTTISSFSLLAHLRHAARSTKARCHRLQT